MYVRMYICTSKKMYRFGVSFKACTDKYLPSLTGLTHMLYKHTLVCTCVLTYVPTHIRTYVQVYATQQSQFENTIHKKELFLDLHTYVRICTYVYSYYIIIIIVSTYVRISIFMHILVSYHSKGDSRQVDVSGVGRRCTW